MKKAEPTNNLVVSEDVRLLLLIITVAVGFKFYKKVQHIDFNIYIVVTVFVGLLGSTIVLHKKKILIDWIRKVFKVQKTEKTSTLIARSASGLNLEIPDKVRLGHVQILGATGRGKSMSVLQPMAIRDLWGNKNVIIVDGKGDLSLAEEIDSGIADVDAEVKVFDFGSRFGQFSYNPLKYGDLHQVVDKILSVFDFENSYYRSVQKEALILVCKAITKCGLTLNFRRLYEGLVDDNKLIEFSNLANDLGLKAEVQNFLREKKDQRIQKLSGLTSQISDFLSENICFHFEEAEGNSEINLAELLLEKNSQEKNSFIYFSLPTLKYQKTAKIFGKLLLQDLAGIIGERENCKEKKYTSVFLDEFSAIAYKDFYQILNKARSARVALHLSHQSLGDLKIISEDFSEIVTTNTNVKCILGINDPVTADYFAKLFGTKTIDKISERMRGAGSIFGPEKTGDGSVRQGEVYKVHPNRMKSYVNGRGVLHYVDECGPVTEEVQFLPFSIKEGA